MVTKTEKSTTPGPVVVATTGTQGEAVPTPGPKSDGLGLVPLVERPVAKRKEYRSDLLEALGRSHTEGGAYSFPYANLHAEFEKARKMIHDHAESLGISAKVVRKGDNVEFYGKDRLTRKRGTKIG